MPRGYDHRVDEPPDTPKDDSTDPVRRAKGLFERIAPVLRDVNAASEQHPVLRGTRDALASKAGDIVRRADEAIGKATAIEGTVIERPAARTAAELDAADANSAASIIAREMPTAPTRSARSRLGIAAVAALLVALVVRRGRRRR